MEITEIKESLSIENLLSNYGLKADRNNRINCPFHEDKTPSMQIYPETNTAYCFSSNCKTHGHSIDVIDFIMYKEGFDKLSHQAAKHEAIIKAKSMTNGIIPEVKPHTSTELSNHAPTEPNYEILAKIFTYFRNGYAIRKENNGKKYLKSRGLEVEKLEQLGISIGYNSAQFHHRDRISREDKQQCEEAGLLIKSKQGSKTETSHTPWARHCVIFPLKDKTGKLTGMYGRSTTENKRAGKPRQSAGMHFYLRNSKGIFYYPNKNTEKLIITESIIDFLSIYQIDELRNTYDFLPIYGTNRLTPEHEEVINNLENLKEIVLFLDGDEPGKKAVKEISKKLNELNPGIKISKVTTPKDEDINSLLQKENGTAEIKTLLENRKELTFSFSNETTEEKPTHINQQINELETTNPNNIGYKGQTADFRIKGGIKNQLDSLKASLQIINQEGLSYRSKPDLYENKQVESLSKTASEKLNIRNDLLEKDLNLLTNLLEEYRETINPEASEENPENVKIKVGEAETKRCINFLKKPNLIKRINQLIEKGGVVREEQNRIFLFVTASSYFTENTLHAIVQGSTSSGKTHLIKEVISFIPKEDVIKLTRVTDSSFYNYGEYQLKNKLIVIEDYDGLKEEAEYAFRELQSNGEIISSTSVKDENTGNIQAQIKRVRGPIGSIIATTRGTIYEDNMSRSFALSVDESKEQDLHVINYQNKKAEGLININNEKEIKRFMQNCMRLLKPLEVINPYASKIHLPEEAGKIRRLNQNFQNIIKQITILNQYQRKRDTKGRLVTEKSDIETACEIMFESILLKVDELDGSLRNFFELLKSYVKEKGDKYEFTRREIRHALKVSKTRQHTYMLQLQELEYISLARGYANRGYKYKITYWDNAEKLRSKIKNHLEKQLEKL